MRILVVGGSGLIGGHVALRLRSQGHIVAIASRNRPAGKSALSEFDHLCGDYVEGTLTEEHLSGFEAMIFAAGNDVRHVQGEARAHWIRANEEGIPRFFETAQRAGVRHAINVGSFYPQVRPELCQSNAYVRSRHVADEGARALSSSGFRVVSVNAPFVVGSIPGLVVPIFESYAGYARGMLAGIERFAPRGGVNFISTRSLSEAISGALERGVGGTAYLLGDQNLTFAEYFGAFFAAAGDERPLQVRDEDHPLMPDSGMYWGAGTDFFYEPDPVEVALLGYRRDDVLTAVNEIMGVPAQS